MTQTQTSSFIEYTPEEYLLIDMANNFGVVSSELCAAYPELKPYEGKDLDKSNFEDRIDCMLAAAEAGAITDMISYAEEPSLFYAGLCAWQQSLEGKPIGYPVSLDACASGLQILSTLVNCERSARHCGVINTGYREDAYTGIYEAMLKRGKATDLDKPLAKRNITRKELKNALMTSLYGSLREPRKVFGEEGPLLNLYYDTVEAEIPGAWQLNLHIQGLWQSQEDHHKWILPDNFHVYKEVTLEEVHEVEVFGVTEEVITNTVKPSRFGLSLCPDIIHSIDGFVVREITRRCYYSEETVSYLKSLLDRVNKSVKASGMKVLQKKTIKGKKRKNDILLAELWKRYKATGFFSSRMLELIDDSNYGMVDLHRLRGLVNSLPKKPFPVLAIHDCFRVHPNYGNDIRRQYNQILSELAASDILSDIASQVTGSKLQLEKRGNISKRILDANYALS